MIGSEKDDELGSLTLKVLPSNLVIFSFLDWIMPRFSSVSHFSWYPIYGKLLGVDYKQQSTLWTTYYILLFLYEPKKSRCNMYKRLKVFILQISFHELATSSSQHYLKMRSFYFLLIRNHLMTKSCSICSCMMSNRETGSWFFHRTRVSLIRK